MFVASATVLIFSIFMMMKRVETQSESMKPITKFLNMTKDETFKIDLVQYSTLIREVLVSSGVDSVEQPFNETKMNMTKKEALVLAEKLYNHQYYFIYSNADEDCLLGINVTNYFIFELLVPIIPGNIPKPTKTVAPYNLTTKQLLSRNMKFSVGQLYFTSTYFQVLNNYNNPTTLINLMETKSIKYNVSSMSDIKDVDVNRTNNWTAPNKSATGAKTWFAPGRLCFFGYYLVTYRETIYLCVYILNTGETELYLKRPLLKKETKVNTFSRNYGFSLDNFTALIEPTPDRAFEMICYQDNKLDIWIMQFNLDEVFSVQQHKVDFNIKRIDFVLRTIMIFYTDDQKNRRSFYLERNPGSRFRPRDVEIFADAQYMKALYSNENVEIIIEMYKLFQEGTQEKGFMAPITHLLYSFNLRSKKMIQISTQIFTSHLNDDYFAFIYKVNSFSTLDMIILCSSVNVILLKMPTAANRNRYGFISTMDAHSGFGSTTNVETKYPLYITLSDYDPWTNHFFVTPFAVTFYNKSNLNLEPKKCDFLRQRVVRPFVKVKYDQNGVKDRLDKFVLFLNDTKLNATVFNFSINFTNEDPLMQHYTIWDGSDLKEFQVNPNFEQRNIDLDILVRGNFILRQLPEEFSKPEYQYYSATLDEANRLTQSSTFIIENFRIANENDLYIQDIEMLLAFGRTENLLVVERIIMLKRKKDFQLNLYSIKDGSNEMKPIEGIRISSNITKIMPVAENTYIWFNNDGGMDLFYANNLTVMTLSFPGVSCIDVEILSHPKIKPAIICLNINQEFAVYYIDQLIAKSLSNSLMKIDTVKNFDISVEIPEINNNAKILVSEFYPGRVFLYHPDAKSKKPNLSIYYLDVEEFPQMIFSKSIVLINKKSEERGFTSKVQDVEFVENRLVVHFRVSEISNFIGVYEFNESYDLQELKLYQLPQSYIVPEASRLILFHKHFQSSMYANPSKPYLLLQFKQSSELRDENRNWMIIDPFGPLLETIPTFLLPRHSEDRTKTYFDVNLFPYYVASVNRIRYYSAGILHYLKNPTNSFRDERKFYYLFQLITADQPKVFFTLEKVNLASYKNLFEDFRTLITSEQNFTFESQYAKSNNKKNQIKSNLKISQKARSNQTASLNSTTCVIDTIKMQNTIHEFAPNTKDAKIIMYNKNFTEIPLLKTTPVFDWEIVAESFFDNSVGTFEFEKPLHLLRTIRVKDVSDIMSMDTFCRAYKLVNGILQCTKKGWVFFYKEDMEIFYADKLNEQTLNQSIRFPFNSDECTESVVVNHSLIAVCTYNNVRNAIITNLIDLSQFYIKLAGINIFAKVSTPRIIKRYENSFMQYSKTIVDERNIKGVANTYYFMQSIKIMPQAAIECLPRVNTTFEYVYGVDSKLTDTAIGVGMIMNYTYPVKQLQAPFEKNISMTAYRISGINMNAGNLVYVQLFEESHHIGPLLFKTEEKSKEDEGYRLFKRIPKGGNKIIILKVNASTDVKKVVFNKASIIDIAFNKEDAILQDENSTFIRFSLINFPSYHSYLFRYRTNLHYLNTSFFKLANPFAEIENRYWNNLPTCFKWACVLVSTFSNRSFIRVYDMRYEELSNPSVLPNWIDSFGNSTGLNNDTNVESKESDTLDVDLIPNNYTIYPIHILNMTDLQLLDFDRENPDNETLELIMFSKPNRIRWYKVNRKTKLLVKNLYFTSDYINIIAKTSYKQEITYLFKVEKWRETDYYKYVIHLSIIAVITIILATLYFKYLKTEQIRIQKQDEEDALVEIELKNSLMSTLHKIVIEQVDQLSLTHTEPEPVHLPERPKVRASIQKIRPSVQKPQFMNVNDDFTDMPESDLDKEDAEFGIN